MNAPNATLCDIYGTKTAAGAGGALVAGLLTNKLLSSESDRMERFIAAAERMNQISRVLEERKMRATRRGLTRPGREVARDHTRYDDMPYESSLFDDSLFKDGSVHAVSAGRTLALQGVEELLEGMDKEAIGALSAMLPTLGKMLVGGGARAAGAAAKMKPGGLISKTLSRISGSASRGGERLMGRGAAFTKAPKPPGGAIPVPPPKAPAAPTPATPSGPAPFTTATPGGALPTTPAARGHAAMKARAGTPYRASAASPTGGTSAAPTKPSPWKAEGQAIQARKAEGEVAAARGAAAKGPAAPTAHREAAKSPWQAKGEQELASRQAGQEALAKQTPAQRAIAKVETDAAVAKNKPGSLTSGQREEYLRREAVWKQQSTPEAIAASTRPTPGTPEAAAAAKTKAKKKGMSSGGKAAVGLTGAAVLGGLYAGAKGVKDYMMVPSGIGGYQGHGTPGLRHNVSNFGGGY